MAKLGGLLTRTIITGFLAAAASPAIAQNSAAPASPPDSGAEPRPEGAAAAPAPATPSGSGRTSLLPARAFRSRT